MTVFVPTGPLPRHRARPLTCLGDAREADLGGYSEFSKVIAPDSDKRQLVRKWWEWDYLAEVAENLDLMGPGRRVVGLGVGHEPLIFYFASRGCDVLATDLYAGDTAWAEARFATAQAVHAASPIPYDIDKVRLENADMRELPCADGEMDFAWSCSSIEHVPTLSDLFKVMHELYRVLKPGGHALLTTEWSLNGEPYLLPGVNAWDPAVLALIRDAFPGFAFVGPDDFSFDVSHPANAPRMRRQFPAGMHHPHARDFAEAYRGGHTGVLLGVSTCVPIAFTLKKIGGVDNQSWADAPVPADLRAYTDGLDHFHAGREAQAVPLLEGLMSDLRGRTDRRQLALHAGRFLLDAKIRSEGLQERPGELRAFVADYLTWCPEGVLQDGDCLDLFAYVLGEAGDYDESARLSRMCLDSPSTNMDHIFELSQRYLTVQKRAGRFTTAVDEVAGYLADMAWTGATREAMEAGAAKSFAAAFDRRERKIIQKAVGLRIDAMVDDLSSRWGSHALGV